MGLIILVVPLIIYYSIVVPLVNRGIIEEIENQRKKAIFFWLLVLFPIGDHIVGYVVYKALCFRVGGMHIYKTVTDVEEQRAYWFYEGLNVFNNSYNDEEYKYLEKNSLVKRGICTNLVKDGTIGNRVCAKDGFKIVYLNYCIDTYNTLPKEHENYKKSCTNADELIAQYHLENVIKVPKSQYSASMSWITLLPLSITIDTRTMKDTKTQEILGKNREITFWGGWFFNIAWSMFGHNKGTSYGAIFEDDFKQKIIPNPYKQQTNQ